MAHEGLGNRWGLRVGQSQNRNCPPTVTGKRGSGWIHHSFCPSINRYRSGLIGLGLGLLLSGCQTLGIAGSDPNLQNDYGNQYVSRSVRGSRLISRTLPVGLRLRRGWQPVPTQTFHPSSDLQAYHPGQAIFLVVLGESKTGVTPGTLEQQSSQYLQMMKLGFDQVTSAQSRTGVSQVNRYPAVQYALQADLRGQSVAYLHTTIEIGDHYYQVVTWTATNRYLANADEMSAITQEFGPE